MRRSEALFGLGCMLVSTFGGYLLGGLPGAILAAVGLGAGLILLVMAYSANGENPFGDPTLASALRSGNNSALPPIPRPIPRLTVDQTIVEVTNMGEGANFYLPITINGPVGGPTSGIFARWEHTNSPKAWIAKGQTYRLILARLEWQNACCRWIIQATAADGTSIDVAALYSSCATSDPVTRAPAIVIDCKVFSEPDPIFGIQPFSVGLWAFTAIADLD